VRYLPLSNYPNVPKYGLAVTRGRVWDIAPSAHVAPLDRHFGGGSDGEAPHGLVRSVRSSSIALPAGPIGSLAATQRRCQRRCHRGGESSRLSPVLRTRSPPPDQSGGCRRGERVAVRASGSRPGMSRISQDEWDRCAAAVGIEWLEPVRNESTNNLARCLNCGREWKASPHHVSRGQRCAQCARKIATQADWDRRGAEVGLAWHAPVAASAVKTPARCLTCGHEWSPFPHAVASGQGCPRCAGNLPLGQPEWDQRAASVGIEWVDPVVGIGTTSRARCLTCDHVWATWPGNVSKGPRLPGVRGSNRDPGRLGSASCRRGHRVGG